MTILIDSGASRNFLSQRIAEELELHAERPKSKNDFTLHLADGTTRKSPGIVTNVKLHINGHEEILRFNLAEIERDDVILGKPWLFKHNPQVDWRKNTVSFTSKSGKTLTLDQSKSSDSECQIRTMIVSPQQFKKIARKHPKSELFAVLCTQNETKEECKENE